MFLLVVQPDSRWLLGCLFKHGKQANSCSHLRVISMSQPCHLPFFSFDVSLDVCRAASVAEDISSFMQRAAAQDDTAQQADEAPAGKRARKSAGHGGRSAQWGPVSIDMLKQLQSSLAAGKQAGILSQLDQEQLRQLLLLLLELVRMGQDQLLDEQDMVSHARLTLWSVLGLKARILTYGVAACKLSARF
jgi:hypothetical protein